MARTKHPFADDEVVVCFEAFGTGAFEGQPVIAPGTRYLGGNPIVRNSPQFFVRDGAPADEITRLKVKLIQDAERDVPQHRTASPETPTEIVRPIPDEEAVVCIVGSHAGERAHRFSPAVESEPSRYVPVIPEGDLERADALLALETMTMIGDDGKPLRTLHKGQWARRDDPLVELHPHHFTLPPYVGES